MSSDATMFAELQARLHSLDDYSVDTAKSLSQLTAAALGAGKSIEDLTGEMSKVGYSAGQIKSALADIPTALKQTTAAVDIFKTGMTALTGAISTAEKIQKLVINTQYQWASIQVQIFQNTIAAISAQNNYAQALALHAMAVQHFGASSVEATRTATAASYVHWQVLAAQQQKALSQVDLQYAYANAITDVGQTALNTISSVLQLATSIGQLGAVSTAASGVTTAAGGLTFAGALSSAGTSIGGALGLSGAAATAAGIALPVVGAAAAGTAIAYEWGRGNPFEQFGEWARQQSGFQGKLPGLAGGGTVAQTGLAVVHEGESYSGVGRGASPSINMTFNVSRDVDLGKLRQEIQNVLSKAFLQNSKTRGVF